MTSPLDFLQQVRLELSRVVWPSRQQAVNLTILVIGVSVAVGLFIGGLDFVLTKLLEVIIQK